MAYEVKLEVFEGPLDLLLHLITRQRVDIYEVSLSSITDEYLGALANMEVLDLESATGFLVVAATLLELKSSRLLPRPEADEIDSRLLEERDLLLARLVECATFREAGAWIATELAVGAAYHGREVPLEPELLEVVPDFLAHTRLDQIARAAEKALEPKPEPVLDMGHVAPIRASVRESIAELAARLRAQGRQSFEELCAGHTEKIEVVVRFLALLELFKAGAIDLGQAHTFGTIEAEWTGEVPVDEVVEDAEEYTIRLEDA